MLFIPFIIILAILGYSFGGNLIHLAFSNLNLNLNPSNSATTKNKTPPVKQPAATQSYKPASPRAPPAATSGPVPAPLNTFQKIRISGFQATNGSQPAQITLRPNFSTENQIDISGWKIASHWNGSFTIPFGTSKFNPGALNSPPLEHIIVRKDDTVYLKGERNPFGQGQNFRPNACFGYLNQYYQGMPESFSCPQEDRPTINQIKNLSPLCQDFILNKIDYGGCKLPDYANVPGVGTNAECVAYIAGTDHGFNFQGCYNRHLNDANFTQNKWYVYMNASFGNTLHDYITLYDQTGKVVDTYIY